MSVQGCGVSKNNDDQFRRILGIRFFNGCAAEAVDQMRRGGLLVAPAAPALKEIPTNPCYREAVLNADVAIADSGFMVLLWNAFRRDRIVRLSGLAYLRELLQRPEVKKKGAMFWIMPGIESADCNTAWLRRQGVDVSPEDIYIAPMYGDRIEDEILLARIRSRQPSHIVVALGGGTQERLGFFLKQNLTSHPAIHCIGAAIGFLSGDQVHIPVWADKVYLGWLFRCISDPKRYISRYWSARMLLPLLLRFREHLPLTNFETQTLTRSQ
jgi:N-acetylglucosaminyldiphosphoundecaprenol N-acetyl-beta-D-mannosaminyltransferase